MATIQGYQQTDAHIVNYEMYRLPGVPRGYFRGPPLQGTQYVACVGAAQTFGRFVRQPFPHLLSATLGLEALNLGRGGAGPTYHVSDPVLLQYINQARVVIVQVLSGRSQSNSVFHTSDHGMVGTHLPTGSNMDAGEFYTWLLQQEPAFARRIVAETREKYVSAMTALLAAIRPPKVLLWFSTRTPEYEEHWELPAWRLMGTFPQMVNCTMIEQLRDHADAYVECISARGSPQPIVDLHGNPSSFRVQEAGKTEVVIKTHNSYYPSPEMHEDAATLLAPVCRALLDGNGADVRPDGDQAPSLRSSRSTSRNT
jgi:hypothetical protein